MSRKGKSLNLALAKSSSRSSKSNTNSSRRTKKTNINNNNNINNSKEKKLDYYEFLGVERTATSIEIKKAYYRLALQMHPDKNPQETEEGTRQVKEKFQFLTKVYQVLSDERKRKFYNQHGELDEDDEDAFGEMAEEDENAEWTIPDIKELERIFNTLKAEKFNELVSTINWNETIDKAPVWTEKIVSDELSRAYEAKIVAIEFTRKSITSIPPFIGQLSQLTKLILCNNKISSLPTEIGQLTSLNELDLNVNELKSLPDSIGELVSLEKCFLEHNKLTTLPSSIGNLKKLQVLKLFSNQLKSVPEEIEMCVGLKELDLELNYLKRVPMVLKSRKMKLVVDPVVEFAPSKRKSPNEKINMKKKKSVKE